MTTLLLCMVLKAFILLIDLLFLTVMPVSNFLASIADKAQSAINASPLASHLPSGRTGSPDPATQPTANEAAAQGQKSHALGAIQNQLRAFGQHYA